MAESVLLVAKERSTNGTKHARRMRKGGQVPGVVYGHGEATLSIAVSGEELNRTIRHGVRVVDLEAGGKVEKALIREIQWDPLGHDILHVDFARVSADERIEVEVRVEIRGTAPGVTASGGVLDQPIHNLLIECLAISIPDSIRVNVGELQLDQAIKVKDLVLPEGVVAKMDPDAIVVHVRLPLVEAEPTAAVPGAAAEAAEPEVIGRQAKPEEGEEGEAPKEKK